MKDPLTSAQVRKLKGLAQRLDPVCKIGKNGLSEGFLESVREIFTHQELIKVKFAEHKDEKKELAPLLAEKTGSHLITVVGNVAVFYRQHPDPENRSIQI